MDKKRTNTNLFFRFHLFNGADGEGNETADADEGCADEHDEISDSKEAAQDEAHDEESIEVTFCDPCESAGDFINGDTEDGAMFL